MIVSKPFPKEPEYSIMDGSPVRVHQTERAKFDAI
jgi:hypothetical protein